jgi:polyferredoxin
MFFRGDSASAKEETASMSEPATVRSAETRPATWRNPYGSLSTVRWIVQAAYLLFVLLVGIEFHGFYRQAVSGGPVTAHRPPAVEGFLPISALMGLKQLLLTGNYDGIHPAGLTILIAAILSSFVARKVFCSWVCPIGGISRALEWVGKKTLWKKPGRVTVMHGGVDLALSSLKYLLLAFFFWAIVIGMDKAAIRQFMNSTYNHAADAKMLLFFTDISRTAAITLIVLAALSVVIKHFWCRYLCPYGALLGLVSWASPQRVARDAETCTDCRACTRACPVEIAVHKKNAVWTPECTGCMSCVAACPVEECLTVTRKGRRSWSPWYIPVVGLGTILLVWGAARITGHWHTDLPTPTLIEAYRQAHTLLHP